ncbi:MAG TPA: serine hydrolase domain-containing protein [Candidatus Limnocylindrales bacterium]
MTGDDCPTVDSVVCVSSVGKQMAAACVGMLVLRGVLDPDAPVREWIPDLPNWAAPITVRHLIHHTSGIPDKPIWDIGFGGTVPDWTNEAVIALPWTGPSMHPPSVTFHPPWHDGVPMPRTAGDGGVWSTARDLLRWAEAMNTAALGDELTDLLHQQGRLNDGSLIPYAWGWYAVPDGTATAYAHGGWWPGCHTYVIHAPASGAAAALVAFTSEPGPVEELGKQLAGIAPNDPYEDVRFFLNAPEGKPANQEPVVGCISHEDHRKPDGRRAPLRHVFRGTRLDRHHGPRESSC